MLPPPRRPHFLAGTIEVVAMDEGGRAVADHFLRRESQYVFAGWTDLDQGALAIRNQDQVLRRFENAAPLLNLLTKDLLGLVAFGDVASGLGCADDDARRGFDGRNAERNLDRTAVLAQALGFVVFDGFTQADPAQAVVHFGHPFGRNDQVETSADRFGRGVSEQSLGRRVPAGDRSAEGGGYDGVVGRFHSRTENPLARRVMVSRSLGAAMFRDLAFQRGGFC